MKRHSLAAVLILAAACAPPQEVPTVDAMPPAGSSAAAADTVPLRRFDESAATRFRYSSGLAQPAREVARDAAAWSALWSRMTAGHQPAMPAPTVDFGREMVLVAALGQRATGGYSIMIESVADAGGELVARVVEQRPGPRCGTTQAVTSPADAVAVPRSAKPVRWAVREVAMECS